MNASNKIEIRKTVRLARQKISLSDRKEAAERAHDLLVHSEIFIKSKHIACYIPMKNEFDTHPIIQAIWSANKDCYLPVLSKDQKKFLYFVQYQKNDVLHLNVLSVMEPDINQEHIEKENLELILMPLVAFDRQGGRIGTGGGYYDRTFSFLKNKLSLKPFLMGVAFACQEVKIIPIDEWDIALDGVVTEKEIFYTRLKSKLKTSDI